MIKASILHFLSLSILPFLVLLFILPTDFGIFHCNEVWQLHWKCAALSVPHFLHSVCKHQCLKKSQARPKWRGRASSINDTIRQQQKYNTSLVDCSAASKGATVINFNNADRQDYAAYLTHMVLRWLSSLQIVMHVQHLPCIGSAIVSSRNPLGLTLGHLKGLRR